MGVMGGNWNWEYTLNPGGVELRDVRRGSADSWGLAAAQRETGSQALP